MLAGVVLEELLVQFAADPREQYLALCSMPCTWHHYVLLARVGRELYEKFFRNYTRKQWALDPSQLDKSVTARVPIRTNRDDRYFTDRFQAMPRDGYTPMFQRMLAHRNITVRLGTENAEIVGAEAFKRVIYTGPIDEYSATIWQAAVSVDPVPARDAAAKWFQAVGTVNYPQDEEFTRISEYKHMTGQDHPWTSITYEYPTADGDPYYPVPRPENQAIYKQYEALADAERNTWFVGRLATYRYLNMDQVVGQALSVFRRIEDEVPRAVRLGGGAAIDRALAAGPA